MYHELFLLLLGLVWVLFASIQDLRERIVSNWISFSLITFAISFRFYYSLFENNFLFFYQGLLGIGIFFVIGILLYYGRFFAAGDAKLMIALGAIFPFSSNFYETLQIAALFVVLFLFSGMLYALIWSSSLFFSKSNFSKCKKEFRLKIAEMKKLIMWSTLAAIFFLSFGFFDSLLFYLGVILFISPYLFIFAKVVDDVCLVNSVKVSKLEEGDWLYEEMKIGNKKLKPSWQGLTKSQINLLRKKYSNVKIKQGIPFVPVFLASLTVFILLYVNGYSFLWIN